MELSACKALYIYTHIHTYIYVINILIGFRALGCRVQSRRGLWLKALCLDWGWGFGPAVHSHSGVSLWRGSFLLFGSRVRTSQDQGLRLM